MRTVCKDRWPGRRGGLAASALVRAGAEVIVMVPKYATIKDEYKAQMEHFSDFYVSLGWRNEYCGLEKLEHDGVTYMFIDNERYFARDYPYGFFDDGERFAFFSKAITESLQHLPAGFECDILHCNDWQTALAPVFLREFYQGLPLYDRVKTVFSIHNVAFQGQFSDTVMEDILGVAHIPAAATQLRCDACSINYMLGALHYADAITTVSPTYAGETRRPSLARAWTACCASAPTRCRASSTALTWRPLTRQPTSALPPTTRLTTVPARPCARPSCRKSWGSRFATTVRLW